MRHLSDVTGRGYEWGLPVDLENHEDNREPKTSHEGRRVPSKVVLEGLKYEYADVDATNVFVLVTPCKMNQDGELVVPEEVTGNVIPYSGRDDISCN